MKFKIIKDFPQYEVSKEGIVRMTENKKIVSQIISPTGYYIITIYDRITKKTKPGKVHRLVADAFLPKVNGKPNINHIDGDKLNNKVSNLEWCTKKESIRHAIKTGSINNTGVNNGRSLLINKDVLKIKKLLKKGVYQRIIAEKFGVSRSAILQIHLGKTWKHLTK